MVSSTQGLVEAIAGTYLPQVVSFLQSFLILIAFVFAVLFLWDTVRGVIERDED